MNTIMIDPHDDEPSALVELHDTTDDHSVAAAIHVSGLCKYMKNQR